jgi:hypothetical protein
VQDKKKKWWVLVHSDTALRNGVIEVNINTQQPNNDARITTAIATQAAARLAFSANSSVNFGYKP